MGYSILFLVIPPYSLIPIGLLLGISFASLYLGKRASRVQSGDIAHSRGSLISIGFAMWGISVCAMYLSLFIMFQISNEIAFFNGIHSEWGIAFENAYVPAAVYIVCWTLLHAALQFPSLFLLRRRVPGKYRQIYTLYLLYSTVLWSALLFLLYLG